MSWSDRSAPSRFTAGQHVASVVYKENDVQDTLQGRVRGQQLLNPGAGCWMQWEVRQADVRTEH